MNSYDLAHIYTEIELYIIKSLKRTFYHHKNEELKEGFQWEQWQLTKLRSMQKFRQDNVKLLGEHSNAIELAILEELNSNYKAGYDGVENVIQKAKKLYPTITFPEDIKPPPLDKVTTESGLTPISDILTNIAPNKVNIPPVEESINFFGMNDKKLKALTDSVTNDLKKAESSLLRQADDIYRQTIFKTHMYLQSGATSLNQAVDMATKDFLEKGFNCVVYKNGARVNIASYAEMALRTASQRATFLGEGKKRDEWNLHLVVVSAHANTCEMCRPWQGKILIDDVYSNGSKADGDYPLLSEAMKSGLLHPNCRHTLATYFPGITKLPEPVDDDKALKNYRAEQEQRYIERQIRRWKRISAGEVDKDNLNNSTNKVKEWQGKLKQHLDDNPHLRRDYEREKPGPGISNKDIKDNVKKIYGDDYFKGGYRYSKDGIMRVTDDWKGKHRSIPVKHKPNSVIETSTEYKNGYIQIDRTIYDKNRMMYKQIHSGNHNKPKQHPYGKNGEHVHIYKWDESGNRISRETRELTKKELNEHRDILGGG